MSRFDTPLNATFHAKGAKLTYFVVAMGQSTTSGIQ